MAALLLLYPLSPHLWPVTSGSLDVTFNAAILAEAEETTLSTWGTWRTKAQLSGIVVALLGRPGLMEICFPS